MTTTERTEKASAEENPLKLSLQEDIEDVLEDWIESRNMQRKSEGRGRKLRWTEQMILIIIAVIILPLMIVIGVLWNSMSQTFEEQAETLVEYKLKESTEFLEHRIDSIYSIMYQMITDQSIRSSCWAMARQSNVAQEKSRMHQRFIEFVSQSDYL